MTKSEIIKAIATKKGFDRATVSQVLEAFTVEIKNALLEGNNVSMRGFGTFYLKHRAEKTARNMQSNTTIIIPAHDIAAFKPAKDGKKKKRHKMSTHKRKKRLRKNRHKSK